MNFSPEMKGVLAVVQSQDFATDAQIAKLPGLHKCPAYGGNWVCIGAPGWDVCSCTVFGNATPPEFFKKSSN